MHAAFMRYLDGSNISDSWVDAVSSAKAIPVYVDDTCRFCGGTGKTP
jgi:hypothetical protein